MTSVFQCFILNRTFGVFTMFAEPNVVTRVVLFQMDKNTQFSTLSYSRKKRKISVECRCHKTSLLLPRYYRIPFTISKLLPWNFPHPRGNYRGYRGITAFPVTVSCSSVDRPFQSTCDQAEQWWQRWAMRWDVVVLAGCQASPRRCKLQHQTVPSRSKTTTTGQPELRQSPPADTVGCQPPYLRHAH